MVLRRAAELNSRRWSRDDDGTPAVSPEVLVQVAAPASRSGTSEEQCGTWHRRRPLSHTLLPGRPTVRAAPGPGRSSGPKVRRRTTSSHCCGSSRGSSCGARRRAARSGTRGPARRSAPDAGLLGRQSVAQDRVGRAPRRGARRGPCDANLTADVSNQRAEYLSIGGIVGARSALYPPGPEPAVLTRRHPALAAPSSRSSSPTAGHAARSGAASKTSWTPPRRGRRREAAPRPRRPPTRPDPGPQAHPEVRPPAAERASK